VRLTDADIIGISAFLGVSEYKFIQDYTRLRPKRDGLALIDKPNGECVFLDGIDCTIQPVKPQQHIFPRQGRVQKQEPNRLRYLGGSDAEPKLGGGGLTPPPSIHRLRNLRTMSATARATFSHSSICLAALAR
jgi:hypothetical protein